MKPYQSFTLFFLLVQAFYFPTWDAGFVTDFTGLLARLEGSPASGILTSFGFPAQQQVLNFFLYLFYHAFGTAPLPWYVIHTGMHALNGWLLYLLVCRIGQLFGSLRTTFPALAGALLFLLLPYQSEVVVWRVCFNYLLSTALLLGALLTLCRWIGEERSGIPYPTLLLFTLALFTFELALTFPLISVAFLVLWPGKGKTAQVRLRQGARLLLPQMGLITLLFLLNRWTLGDWIGHYGAKIHLNYSLVESPGRFLQYSAKLLGLARYYPHSAKEALFSWLLRPAVALSGAGLVVFITALLVWYRQELSPRIRAAGLFFTAYVATLLPVLPLFFNYLLYVENDRHSYFASAFLGAGVALLASGLPRYWKHLLIAAWLLPSAWLTWQTNQLWRQATSVYRGLLDGFDAYDAETVYLLDLPDNLQGVMLFRDYGGHGTTFLDALRYIRRRPYPGRLYEVASYNMTTPADGVEVTQPASDSLIVTFRQWGNWWWRDGAGAGDQETDDYRFLNRGHHYELIWKAGKPAGRVLVQEGDSWQEIW